MASQAADWKNEKKMECYGIINYPNPRNHIFKFQLFKGSTDE